MLPTLQVNLNLFFKPKGPIISELRGLSTDFSIKLFYEFSRSYSYLNCPLRPSSVFIITSSKVSNQELICTYT